MSRDSAFNVPMHLSDFSVIDSEFNSIRERFDAEMRKMEDEMSRFRSELLNRESSSSNVVHKSSTTQSQHKSEMKTTEFFKTGLGKPKNSPSHRSSSNMVQGGDAPGGQHRSELRTWLDGLESPLIKEGQETDGKCLALRFDVSQYKPEEIVVKTVDQKLQLTSLPVGGCCSVGCDHVCVPDSVLSAHDEWLNARGFTGHSFTGVRGDYDSPVGHVVGDGLVRQGVHAKHEEKSDTRSVYREYNREFLLPKGTNPELIKSTLSKDGVLTVEAPLPQQAITAGETAIPVEH
ncbi:unnamed protein product [Cyprideis torosa]|uniref:Uncharacterized protein n=1 Tax=Cyprideis torosa TaxID=163714 RepID=A0A7R8W4F9_9CRUS|nr:unnamed protein product [Cyprideis torosa]CAG0883997.1 unnamed protein product [Cyprideis torosa]